MSASSPSEQFLIGASVLVVEDESLILYSVEDSLRIMGCRDIWLASSVDKALLLLEDRRPQLAILDVNLTGKLAYPAAVRLDDMGVPVVFLTAYDRKRLPSFWHCRPIVNKPFTTHTLAAAIRAALARPPGHA